MRILFTGGGTGGHFYPIVAVSRELKKIIEEERILGMKMYYIGPDDFGHDILKKDEIDVRVVISGKMRRYASLRNIIDFFKVIGGTVQAFFVLFSIMPDVIFSKGGYGSLPVVIVSFFYGIPLIIHESDSRPGIVNRVASLFADRVAISFESSIPFFFSKKKIALTGNPIRKNVLGGSKEAGQEEFSIFSRRPVILIMGGSQGSEIINKTLMGALRELTKSFEIIHQTGRENFEGVSGEASVILNQEEKTYYHPVAFFDDRMLRSVYAVADICVSRAGSASIFEIAAAGKPSILIPLKNSAQEHQKQNAYEYSQYGAAAIIEEDNLIPSVFLNEIRKLLNDKERLALMTDRAKKFSKPDSAEVIAREVMKLGIHSYE